MKYQRIKKLRDKYGKAPQELAVCLGITQSKYLAFEDDTENLPIELQLELICAIATFYQTSVDYLLERKDEEADLPSSLLQSIRTDVGRHHLR